MLLYFFLSFNYKILCLLLKLFHLSIFFVVILLIWVNKVYFAFFWDQHLYFFIVSILIYFGSIIIMVLLHFLCDLVCEMGHHLIGKISQYLFFDVFGSFYFHVNIGLRCVKTVKVFILLLIYSELLKFCYVFLLDTDRFLNRFFFQGFFLNRLLLA